VIKMSGLKSKFIEKFDGFLHNNMYSKFGKIGPNTMQEAHQIHAGVWLGLVKIWTPYGLYKELTKYDDKTLKEIEAKDLQYRFGFLTGSFALKIGAIALATQLGVYPLAACGEVLPLG